MKVGDVVYIPSWDVDTDYPTDFIQIMEKGIIIDKRQRDYTDIDPERELTDHDIDFLVFWSSNGKLKWAPKITLKPLEIDDE